MISLQEYTPEIYYKQSRDFQLLGRFYDLVLNSVKTSADMIYDIPSSDAVGSKLVDLLALTLGFKAIHSYNLKQLTAICSILPTILKYKGSKHAIDIVCQTVLTAEGIPESFDAYVKPETHTLYLAIPHALSDISLLKDLLFYILPAGLTVELTRITADTFNPETYLRSIDDVAAYGDSGLGGVQQYIDMDDPTAKTSYIPTLSDMTANAKRIIDYEHHAEDGKYYTNDRNYRGMTENILVDNDSDVGEDE